MSALSNLIRGKSGPVGFATATPATFATLEGENMRTVATVATVAVANLQDEKTAPLAPEDEARLRSWLDRIGEDDQTIVEHVIRRCRDDGSARDYFVALARQSATLATQEAASADEVPRPLPDDDDRRRCARCANLAPSGLCLAARRGEIVASQNYEPIRGLPRRCEGFAPGADDPDRRHGRERWPGLIQKGGE
jgi:hypothetical protein